MQWRQSHCVQHQRKRTSRCQTGWVKCMHTIQLSAFKFKSKESTRFTILLILWRPDNVLEVYWRLDNTSNPQNLRSKCWQVIRPLAVTLRKFNTGPMSTSAKWLSKFLFLKTKSPTKDAIPSLLSTTWVDWLVTGPILLISQAMLKLPLSTK